MKENEKIKYIRLKLPKIIDGKSGNEYVTEGFKEKYKELNNEVNDSEINDIRIIFHNKLQNCISGEYHQQHKFKDINM